MAIDSERVYTASTSSDTDLETWIRDEAGQVDLSGVALEVLVRPYSGRCPAATLGATGDAEGRVQWSVTADQARRLGAGLYRVVIRRADRGELLHRGTLEVQF